MQRSDSAQATTRRICSLALTAIGTLQSACAGSHPTPAQADPQKETHRPAVTTPAPPHEFSIPILFTSDEHGWIEAHHIDGDRAYEGGYAYLLGQWKSLHHYTPDRFLTLSGGDSWTGPYESTVLRGAPVVDLMNLMGYDAQAIGNHDFDFGQDNLLQRAQQAHFPLVAANIYRVGSQLRPAYAVGHAVVQVAGERIGVIAASNIDTPVVTHPRNVAGLAFTEIEPALRREMSALKATGVEIAVSMIHEEVDVLLPMASVFRELGISFIGSGHSHRASLSVDRGDRPGPEDDLIFCNPGPYARAYCFATLHYRGDPPRLVGHEEQLIQVHGSRDNPPYPVDAEALALVQAAREEAASTHVEPLATSTRGLRRDDPDQRLGHMVVDAWLEALPDVQMAITNAGGLRQDIDPGDVTLRTVVGVLPFENYLLIVELTGAQLKQVLAHPQTIAGGVRFEYRCLSNGRREILRATDLAGKPINDAKTYRVVVNEFIYRGGDRYAIRELDPTPEETAIHWREPVLRYLKDLRHRGQKLDLKVDGRAHKVGKGGHCSVQP